LAQHYFACNDSSSVQTAPFIPMAAVAGLLRKGEEDWQERIERLQERFPTAGFERVLQALRDHGGHAGYAATHLRDLTLDQKGAKDVDPDDQEWVATLLTSPAMFRQYCKSCFQEFDTDRNGVLDWSEVVGLTTKLCRQLGLAQPSDCSLRTVFDEVDSNGDQVLQENEFAKFFESFLRYAFFVEHRRLVGTWQYKSNPNEQADAGYSEYVIFQTTDWHLCIEGLQGQCPGGHQLGASSANRALGGIMELRDGWLHSKVKVRVFGEDGQTIKKTTYGFLRLHCAEGNNDALISNFKSSEIEEWGEDIVAYRKSGDTEKRANTPPGDALLQCKLKKPQSGMNASAFVDTLRCLAPYGVACRGSPQFHDRTDAMVACGDKVRVLEKRDDTWFRTVDGWLPMQDAAGKVLFARSL